MAYRRYRLEGDTHSDEIESGLQAPLADPLWMLARQWQVGEFRGEDAASPVYARFALDSLPISTLRPFHSKSYTPIDPFVPLEAYVEQQPPGDLAGFWRSAEAGLHLLRMFTDSGLDVLRSQVRHHYALKEPERLEPGEKAWASLLLRRTCDGERIYHSPAALEVVAKDLLEPDQLEEFDSVVATWRQWYDDRLFNDHTMDCWNPERMEYGFDVRAANDEKTIVLSAKEYPGGHLDWYSFDMVREKDQIKGEAVSQYSQEVLPAPVQFAGMAASRWWQFEDGVINFGDINTGPADFARMITAAFATAYGDDYYVIPVKVPIGSLARIVSLKVRDSFGEEVDIDPVAALDGGEKRAWRFFEMKGDGAHPHLFIPAVALGRMEGKSVETVTLIRDETENIGWGVENTYEGATERIINRVQQWATIRSEAVPTEELAPDTWKYTLLNRAPPYWIPFIPVRTNDDAQIRLRRGRMAEWELLPAHLDLVGIYGNTLLPSPMAPLLIHEEEVPMSGIEVASSYQFARDASGRSYVWLGKRKRPAGKLTPIIRDTDAIKMGST